MSGVRTRADAFVSWGWDYFSTNRAPAIVDGDKGRIDWGDPDEPEPEAAPGGRADGSTGVVPQVGAQAAQREPDLTRTP